MASRDERRRRREIERRLRELDRLDRQERSEALKPRRDTDWRGRIAIAVTVVVLTLVAFAAPGLVPVWIRQAVGLGPDRLADPVDTADAGTYAFIAHQERAAEEPVTWDPCQPIRYRVNPAGAPPGSTTLLQQAVARVEDATGLRFRYVGRTEVRPKWDSPLLPVIGTRRPVLVSWATADEVRQLAGDVAGIGGAVPLRASDGRLRFVTGGVTLDADSFADLANRPHGRAEERAIILHELGHLVGLAHVSDPTELMNGDNVGLVDFGPGDLAGMARLGRGPCF